MESQTENSSGNSENQRAGATAAEILGATAQIQAEHTNTEPAKRGPGRPRKHPLPDVGGSASPGAGEDQGAGNPAPLPPCDPGLIRSCVGSMLQAVDGILIRHLSRSVYKVSGDGNLAKSIAEDFGMTTEERDNIAKLTAIVFEKHSILGANAPEVFLGVSLVGYAARMSMGFEKIRALERLNQKPEVEKVPEENSNTN